MDLMDAIYRRRSVRHFTDQTVTKTAVMELLRAATWAPSAVNQQPWAFVVIRGRQQLAEYSERAKLYLLEKLPWSIALHRRSDALANPNHNIFNHAGTLIVICAKPAEYVPAEDCCMAAQNLLLAAHGMGLGSCPIGFVRPWLNLEETKSELGIPLNYSAVMPVVVGWPAAIPAVGSRTEPEIARWWEHADAIPAAAATGG